jgi:hypothetical protein
MFGGLAFLIRGNMALAASSEGGAIIRVDPVQSDALVATTKAALVNLLSTPAGAKSVAVSYLMGVTAECLCLATESKRRQAPEDP